MRWCRRSPWTYWRRRRKRCATRTCSTSSMPTKNWRRSARAIAGEWKLPLVKFDASAIFDKFIGESEKRMDRVFKVAEQLAPCVLWIDELEKVFAGSGPDSASVDAGLSSRLLGSFLGWMQ